FISDIASFELKPLFLIGASITAVGFVTTVSAVHVVRYEPGFALVKCPVTNNRNGNGEHGLTGHRSSYHSHCDHHDSYSEDEEDHETTRTLKLISLLAIFAAAVASIALILLAVMDTFRYKSAHHLFLQVCFAGLAIQSACTAIVYSNEVLGFVSYVYHLGYIIDHCVRTNFDGYVPSVLYSPPIQRKDIEPPESLPGQIRNWDPERAPLVEGPSGGRYT
ncbi:hypothetical protein G4B11_006775, partial [Aspergillus flavus]